MAVQYVIDIKLNSNMLGVIHAGIQEAMVRSTQKLLQIGQEKAIESYKEQRISEDMPSMIIDSFQYVIEQPMGLEVRGKVFVDSVRAPWAIYVDEIGWKTKKGHKPGYKFMEAGTNEVKERADDVIIGEFAKL